MGTIYLGSAPKRNIFKKFLDELSAPLSQPIITLTRGLNAGGQAVSRQRRKIRNSDSKTAGIEALKVVGTTVASTAVVAGSVLAGAGAGGGAIGAGLRGSIGKVVLSKPVIKTLGGVGAVALLAPKTFNTIIKQPGLPSTIVAGAINPVAGILVGLEKGTSIIGGGITNFLKDPSISGGIQTAKDIALPAGIIGAGTVAGILAGKKILEGNKVNIDTKDLTAGLPQLPSVINTPSISSNPGSVVTSSSSPVVASSQKEKVEIVKPASIKNYFKPQINIAIAQ